LPPISTRIKKAEFESGSANEVDRGVGREGRGRRRTSF
jgi:hypothetical protein